MSVLLVFDKYGIDETPALIVSADRLLELRERVRQHLRNSSGDSCLRVRMPPEYRQRFADFIGLNGVECLFVEPRSEFAKRFGITAPPWLTDNLLVALGLHRTPATPHGPTEWAEDSTGFVLYLFDSRLVQPESWQALCNALRNPQLQASGLLHVPEVWQRLAQSAQAFLASSTVANRFMEKIASTPSPEHALIHWGQQQIYERLREFVTRYEIAHALPPRTEPTEFLAALPPLALGEDEAGELIGDLLHLLEETLHAIEAGQSPTTRLAELLIMDWPRLFAFLQDRIKDARISLASQELVEALDKFSSHEARDLAELVRQQLISCPPLSESADTHAVKIWIKSYLEYALRRFLLSQEPDETVSGSFSSWVLQQQARIARSDLDWRRVASIIREQLRRPETRVIVCMVDALSAVHNEQVLEILHQHLSQDELALERNFLIAPYPTLTEIGKNAILTGKPAHETNGPIEKRLYQVYQDSLSAPDAVHVIKSWTDRNQLIPEQTRLLVYLENRIDERLHGCTDYVKFNNDVEVIIKQLTKELNRWIIQSRKHGLDPVVLITADHGLSYIRETESSKSIDSLSGEYGERTIAFPKMPSIREGFAQAEAGDRHYLIPLQRVRLKGETPLSHGGLTPEELLIPCIILRKDCSSIPLGPLLQVSLKQQNAVVMKDGWQLELVLKASCPAQNIRLEAQPPFRGQAGPYGPLHKGETTVLTLLLAADFPQEGLTQVDLNVSFVRPDLNNTKEQLYTKLSVNFPASFLEKDVQATAFESMF
jgi:hypothetical protein